jgi:hypothetical protein
MTSKLAAAVSELGLNLSDVEPGAGTGALPTGMYTVRVRSWQETVASERSQNPGALAYIAKLEVVGGKYNGHPLTDVFVIAGKQGEKALGRLKGLAVACGVSVEETKSDDFDPTTEWGEERIEGKTCQVYVTFSEASGDYSERNFFDKYQKYVQTREDVLDD